MGLSNYAHLPTEKPHPLARNLDLKSSLEIVRLLLREEARAARAVLAQSRKIAKAADAVSGAWRRGARLFFVGAGTSGRLGVLEAAECPPTFGLPPSRIQAVMAGGKSCVFRSREGAEDEARDGAWQIRRRVKNGDVAVCIAASAVTPFARGALAEARRRGCLTILVTANARVARRAADIVIAPAIGPEVVTGSTRLKAGTSAKLVLNAITTTAMVRLGKVHDHWMVDLKPASRKLRERALRMLCDLGRVDRFRARRLLAQARGSIKVALLMARMGLSASQARLRLSRSQDSLRRALKG